MIKVYKKQYLMRTKNEAYAFDASFVCKGLTLVKYTSLLINFRTTYIAIMPTNVSCKQNCLWVRHD